jgi:PH domain
MKLTKVTDQKWKKRFFELNDYTLKYFEKKTAPAPRGELQLLDNAAVTSMGIYMPEWGYVFKVENSKGSMMLAAQDDEARSAWIEGISFVIARAKSYLRCTIMKQGSGFLSSNKLKYFILGNGLLTSHPDATKLSTIEQALVINQKARVDNIDDRTRSFTVIDGDQKSNKLTLIFPVDGVKDFKLWLDSVTGAIRAAKDGTIKHTVIPAAVNGSVPPPPELPRPVLPIVRPTGDQDKAPLTVVTSFDGPGGSSPGSPDDRASSGKATDEAFSPPTPPGTPPATDDEGQYSDGANRSRATSMSSIYGPSSTPKVPVKDRGYARVSAKNITIYTYVLQCIIICIRHVRMFVRSCP